MVHRIVYDRFGSPPEVLRVEEAPAEQLAPTSVRVRVLAATIHPADLNTIEGKYPSAPKPPAVPGIEAVATVTEAGVDVAPDLVGRKVIFLNHVGLWASECVVPQQCVYPIPGDLPTTDAAMLKTNPATAWRLLHDFVTLQPGDWVIQNSANSASGRCVIQLAKSLGLRTINIVRRPELIQELDALGSDATLLDDDDVPDRAGKLTGKARCALAINAVGGRSSMRLSLTLRRGGTIVTVGAMGLEPSHIPASKAIFSDVIARGFWLARWSEQASRAELDLMFGNLIERVRERQLQIPIEAEYPLARIAEAVQHAMRDRRRGKILLWG